MPSFLPLVLLFLCVDPPAEPPQLSAEQVVAAVETVLADAIAQAEESVVAIARVKSENDETLAIRGRNSGRNPVLEPPQLGFPRTNADPFSGDVMSFDYASGVVVGEKGEILTAFHAVRGAASLHVRAMGRQAFYAEITAADPRSDLAVIAPKVVRGFPAPKLKPIALGNASKLRKGAFLVALGNSFNAAGRDGRPSASWGILSNIARRLAPTVEEEARQEFALRHYPTLLQLDSKLNLGMSGGAVINMKGELVGLTTAAANAAGFDAQAGYAIPVDTLGRKVIETLKQGKEYEYGFLGIRLDTHEFTNKVMSADQGSPAAEGGVLVDDLIVAVGDMPVTDADSLVVAINSVPAGEPVKIELLRRNTPIERTVQLAKLHLKSPPIATNRAAPWRGLWVDYTSTLASTTFGPDFSEAMAKKGVVVTEVESGSEADRAGLKTGQLVTRIDGQSVPNPREFARVVAGLKGPARLETDQGPVTVK
jgi:S1-C subfamily serine protease